MSAEIAPGLPATVATRGPVPVAAAAPAPLVLVAHGTRDVRGAPLLERVADRVGGLLPGTDVRHGWVEFQRPSAAEALAGSTRPVVVPLFLGGGYHVEHDLPRLVRAHGSGTITAHLGPEPIIVEAVAERLREALASEGAGAEELDGVVLAAAGSRRRAPVVEAEAAARGLSRLLGTPVRPAYLSAAEPSARHAVRHWRSEGAETLAVATYLLAEGHFSRALHGADADLVAPPLGDHPAVAEIVAHRYRAATGPSSPASFLPLTRRPGRTAGDDRLAARRGLGRVAGAGARGVPEAAQSSSSSLSSSSEGSEGGESRPESLSVLARGAGGAGRDRGSSCVEPDRPGRAEPSPSSGRGVRSPGPAVACCAGAGAAVAAPAGALGAADEAGAADAVGTVVAAPPAP